MFLKYYMKTSYCLRCFCLRYVNTEQSHWLAGLICVISKRTGNWYSIVICNMQTQVCLWPNWAELASLVMGFIPISTLDQFTLAHPDILVMIPLWAHTYFTYYRGLYGPGSPRVGQGQTRRGPGTGPNKWAVHTSNFLLTVQVYFVDYSE